jgi:small conductance mechanosensitive channel
LQQFIYYFYISSRFPVVRQFPCQNVPGAYGIRLLIALVILFIGWKTVGLIGRRLGLLMEKRGVDPSLRSFGTTLLSVLLKVLIVVSILGMVGVEMTSFIAIIGAAGLAIGLALSGTLQNFAGGALILLFKPFRVGDFIDAQGHMGTVSEIQVFNTVLKTPDNKTVIIPNGGLATGSMTNFQLSRKGGWTGNSASHMETMPILQSRCLAT